MLFSTTVTAIDPEDGELKTWHGPPIEAIGIADAKQFLRERGMPYAKVEGVILSIGENDIPKQKLYN